MSREQHNVRIKEWRLRKTFSGLILYESLVLAFQFCLWLGRISLRYMCSEVSLKVFWESRYYLRTFLNSTHFWSLGILVKSSCLYKEEFDKVDVIDILQKRTEFKESTLVEKFPGQLKLTWFHQHKKDKTCTLVFVHIYLPMFLILRTSFEPLLSFILWRCNRIDLHH